MADDPQIPAPPASKGPAATDKSSGPATSTAAAAPAAQEQPSGIEVILGDILHNKALAKMVVAFFKNMLGDDGNGPPDQEQTASAAAKPSFVPTGNPDVDKVARTFAATFDALNKTQSDQQYEGQGPQLSATARTPSNGQQVGS